MNVDKRFAKAMRQEGRGLGLDADAVASATEMTERVLVACGDHSKSRQMKLRIGKSILAGNRTVWAPACPDYSHVDGKYDFRELRGGVSLLAQLHIEFLHGLTAEVPGLLVKVLVADHEADDPHLCRALSISRDEFGARVEESVAATASAIEGLGWQALKMTDELPELVAREGEIAKRMAQDEGLAARITTDVLSRAEMYQRLGVSDEATMRERTIATAAQYVALGEFATEAGVLVCNHTTVNLAWYKESGAALLHNAVSIY